MRGDILGRRVARCEREKILFCRGGGMTTSSEVQRQEQQRHSTAAFVPGCAAWYHGRARAHGEGSGASARARARAQNRATLGAFTYFANARLQRVQRSPACTALLDPFSLALLHLSLASTCTLGAAKPAATSPSASLFALLETL